MLSETRSLTAHKHKAVSKMRSGARISPAAPLIAVLQPFKIVYRRSREKPLFAFRMHNPSRRLSRIPARAMGRGITTPSGDVDVGQFPAMSAASFVVAFALCRTVVTVAGIYDDGAIVE